LIYQVEYLLLCANPYYLQKKLNLILFSFIHLSNIIEEVETADQYGLDVYGLGEHHRPDYAVSDPVTVLAAAATASNVEKRSYTRTGSSDDNTVTALLSLI
jgi:hypothetical protein